MSSEYLKPKKQNIVYQGQFSSLFVSSVYDKHRYPQIMLRVNLKLQSGSIYLSDII